MFGKKRLFLTPFPFSLLPPIFARAQEHRKETLLLAPIAPLGSFPPADWLLPVLCEIFTAQNR